MLRILEEQAGVKPAEVGTIRRQRGEYRQAVEKLAAGNIAAGFDRLDALGWIQEIPGDEQDARIAADYADAIENGQTALVVSPTHAQGRHLTRAIRSDLQQRDAVGKNTHLLTRLEPLHLTESERRDAAFYRPGDVVVFHQNAPGHCKRERIFVTSPPGGELLRHADRFSVYRTDYMWVAPGEILRATAKIKTKDGKHRSHNGTNYKVERFNDEGDLVLSNGWTVSRNVGQISYGYVSTSHSSQGRTVDRLLLAVLAESFAAAGREQFYVSVSRGRRQATIYTDDKVDLRAAVQASQTNLTATDLFDLDQARRKLAEQQRVWNEKARPRRRRRSTAVCSLRLRLSERTALAYSPCETKLNDW